MSIKNYIFLDTNMWIYCCLDSQENFSHSALVKIYNGLEREGFTLVVPETVEAELFARLDEHLKKLRTTLTEFKRATRIPYPTYQKRLENTIDQYVYDANDNFEKSKQEILKIFGHRNTVRLKLDSNIFTAAFLRCLRRKRPYRVEKIKRNLGGDEQLRITETQNDAVIVEELIAYFSKLKDYKLYLGSYDGDYADNQTLSLHQDINENLKNAELYKDLSELLKVVKVNLRKKTKEEDKILKEASSLTGGLVAAIAKANADINIAAAVHSRITQDFLQSSAARFQSALMDAKTINASGAMKDWAESIGVSSASGLLGAITAGQSFDSSYISSIESIPSIEVADDKRRADSDIERNSPGK